MTTPTPSAHSGEQGKPSEMLLSKLRRLVDLVWNTATESQEVPSMSWADELISKVFEARELERSEELERKHEQSEPVARNLFAPDDIVRHVRGGNTYKVLGRCIIEATLADCYMYRGTDGQTWVRPAHEMEDGRFEHVGSDTPPPSEQAGISDEVVERALNARVPGGAQVKDWLPTADDRGNSPAEVSRAVIRAALQSAFPRGVGSGLATDENLSLVIGWSNDAAKALRELMAAYERRVRSACATPEALAAKPWECAEFVGARDVLDRKPNWFVTIPAHPAPEAQAEKPVPFDYIYEWDCGGYVHRSLSSRPYNGNRCDRTHAVYLRPQPSASEAPSAANESPSGEARDAEGFVLAPVRLPAEAVSAIKDMLADEYGIESLRARTLWANLLRAVVGLSIEQQEAINDRRAAIAAQRKGE